MVDAIGIFDESFNSLERAMRIATQKQSVIAHNIANAKTPGYEPMTFDEHLMKAVKKEGQKQVVLEQELADLTKNSERYSAYVKLMSAKLNILRTIATQGRR